MRSVNWYFVFFFKQKTAYEMDGRLEFRRVLFRSEAGGRFRDAIPLFDLTDLRAICLSSREGATARSSTRIDCVSVTWTEQDRERHRLPRVGRHISPRDPILQRPAKHYHDYRPGCARCWE